VHLAALQVPFCKADPTLGARVNVVGTVNVFEAVAAGGGQVRGLAYASSIAAYDALDVGEGDELHGQPSTLYGVYKRANEGTAHVYAQDRGVASIGLRPHTVYGPGRDQGLTSQPTAAMLAAARGEPFHIGFGGRLSMQYAEDVARDFVAAARAATDGAHLVNVTGTVASMAEIVSAIESAAPSATGTISFADEPLPFPEDVRSANPVFTPAARTPLAEGVAATIARFRSHSR
jgi:nucleoside-diphosphate-sugar epimerase